jgi:hypothetical protein
MRQGALKLQSATNEETLGKNRKNFLKKSNIPPIRRVRRMALSVQTSAAFFLHESLDHELQFRFPNHLEGRHD